MAKLKRERLIAVFFAAWLALPGIAQNLHKRVTLRLQNVPLTEFFRQVKAQTGLNFIYRAKAGNNPLITLEQTNKPVKEILEEVMRKINCDYSIEGNLVTILPLQGMYRILKGQVSDNSGKPLPGVNVFIRNSKMHTITDENGYYHLSIPCVKTKVSFTYVGMNEEVRTIETGGTPIEKNITMDDGKMLKDVVVTGIFNKPKASFTGAATIITKDEIAKAGNLNLLKSLSNIDPSFDLQEANQSGADPNQKYYIEIRGSSTIGNIENLQNDERNQRNMPLFILDGFEVTADRIMDMNQSDVESVVILKDASATAIYGSRGSNGVVVITSVKPRAGKLRVSYSVGLNLEIPDLSSYHLMNSFDKIALEKEAGLYTNTNLDTQLQLDQMYNENLLAANEGVNTDWIHKPLRTGVGQYHKVDISGGNNQFQYILNFSYNQLNGAMKGSDRDNYNGSMMINYNLKKIRFSNNLSLGFNTGTTSPYGQFSQYVVMNPYWRPFDNAGNPIVSYQTLRLGSNSSVQANPLYDAAQTSFNNSEYTNIRNTTMLQADITPEFRAEFSVGFTQERGGSDYFVSPKSSTYVVYNSVDVMSRGMYTKQIRKNTSYQLGGTLSYAKVIDKHSLFLGVNYQQMENSQNDLSLSVRGFANDQMHDISNANSYMDSKPQTNESTTRSIGVTGTLNYSFDSRYFVDGSYRMDGASSFGSESRWAPFWSVGLGWEFAREKFIEKWLPFINSGRIRYSYGVTGSMSFSAYEALTTYKYNTDVQYNGLSGSEIVAYGNPRLKWQNTKENNLGIDITMFNSRLSINFNLYRKLTDNLVGDVYLPISHGYSSYKENFGTVRNTGIDLAVSYNIIRIPSKRIDWSVRAGIYHNTNILVKLSDAIKIANKQYEGQNSSAGTFYQYREGYSMDDLWVLASPGIDPNTGKRLYINTENNTVTTNISGIKQISAGSTQPKINGRFGTSFRWKSLFIDVGFGVRWGGKKLNSTLLNRVENANIYGNVDYRASTLRWKYPGDKASFKGISNTDASVASSAFVFTERTLTLNSINITYELPQSVIRKIHASRVALTASMTDIFYISNIEQERGTDYPYARRPMFTLAFTF